MADNAIDKLFEEMRAARIAYEDAARRQKEAVEARDVAAMDAHKAQERMSLLQSTLDTHIHEGVPVIQAKMIAHEKQAEQAAQNANNSRSAITTGAITAGAISANHIRVGSLASSLTRPGSITSGPTQF